MSSKRKLPGYIAGTIHQFRLQKRRELRKAMAELEPLCFGCSFTPAYKEIAQARKSLQKAKKLMAQKEWGK